MAYKERKFVCEVCGAEFKSKQKSPRSCSKSCKMKLTGKQLKAEKVKSGICERCGNKFNYVPSTRHPVYKFCSQECRYKAHVEKIKSEGIADETKKKISEKLSGVSLKDRGFSDESIKNSVDALKNAGREWDESIKGKTYEDIHGEERPKS